MSVLVAYGGCDVSSVNGYCRDLHIVKLLVFLWHLFQSFLVLDPTWTVIELWGGGGGRERGKREGRRERGKRERKRERKREG